jgi:hypothetical protein
MWILACGVVQWMLCCVFYPKRWRFLSCITLLFDKTCNSNLIRNQGLRGTKRRPRLSLERCKPSLIFQVTCSLYLQNKTLFFISVNNLWDKINRTAVWHYFGRSFRTILKKGNSSTKSLAYTTLVCPILEYGAACWDTYKEGQIHALDRVQKKADKFAHLTNESNWETLSHRRKISRICAVLKAYSG